MKEEYISVAEFAEKAGISVQAVYKRFKPKFKLVEGKKMLKTSLLAEFGLNPSLNQVETEFNENEALSRTITMLEKELEIKNDQIRELNANLTQTHVLLDQQQKLQAISEQNRIESKEEPKQESLLNRDKFSTEAEYTKFLKRLLPNINMFSGKKELQEQEYVLELMSEEERQLIFKKGYVKGLDYLLDPSIKKD